MRSPSLDKAGAIGAWLELEADAELVVVKSGKVEIGQRITRALRAIVCAELQLAPRQVTTLPVSTRYSPDEGYTAGSNSIEHSGLALRLACRSLLTLMQKRAARRFNVEPGDVTFANGEFSAPTSDETLTLWHLFDGDIADAAIVETGNFNDNNEDALRALHGGGLLNVSPVDAHPDDAAQFDGTLQFVHDLACDLHARVVRPPHPGGRLGAIAEAPIRAAIVPLILVVDGSFVAVAGDDEWRVIKAAERLAQQLPWQRQYELPAANVTASLCDYPRDSLAVVAGTPDPDAGSAALEPLSENYDYDALFTRPYQMHGSIGPSAALATWSDGQLDIVSHTQGVFPLRSAIAEAIGLPSERVNITHAPGAGCYGHNGADDAAFDAALVARAVPGRTVLLKWSRADEHRYEPYASAMAVRIRATMAADGTVEIWEHDSYSDTHVARPRAGLGEAGRSRLLAAHYTTDPAPRFRAQANLNRHGGIHRNADPIYDFAQSRIAKHLVHHLPLRVSAMRTLGAFSNIFAIESAMDELAQLAQVDPLDFRLRHLPDARMAAVLEACAYHFGWRERHHSQVAGVGFGLGMSQYKNAQTRAATAVQLCVRDDGNIQLQRMVIAADAGSVVDENGLKAQLEGGALQAASWTLYEAVQFDESGILSSDWDSYPILRFANVPDIQVVLLDDPSLPSVGAGEASSGPTGGAIANALADATGLRLRELPLTADAVRETALQAND